MNSKIQPLLLCSRSTGDVEVICEDLSERTALDTGQARAIVLAFKNNLALIQGPPGIGKSYVGIQIAKCLLPNRTALELGPIFCVLGFFPDCSHPI